MEKPKQPEKETQEEFGGEKMPKWVKVIQELIKKTKKNAK